MTYSLRSALAWVWVLILIMSIAIGAILIGLVRQGVSGQLEEAAARTRAACAAIKDRYDRFFSELNRPPAPSSADLTRREMIFLLEVVLADFEGMEGGIWNPRDGFAGYAYPTYQGSGPKRDVPEAERRRIADLADKVSRQGVKETQRSEGRREALILHGCPLTSPNGDVAWTMTRVSVESAAANVNLRIGLAILFLFAVLSGGWLWWLRRRWSSHLHQLEQAIAASPLEQLPHLQETGEKDLDRIVTALNQLSRRLTAARDETAQLSQKLARTDRLAALGRMTAALAHEIRNPIAAMRLKAENALTQSAEKQELALKAVLQQVQRLDGLLQRLMAIIQPVVLDPQPVSLRAWLEERVAQHQEQADRLGIRLCADAPDDLAIFDSNGMARALDNLVLNALAHTPPAGQVDLSIQVCDGKIRFSVEDSGPGVPEGERERIFEPFMTTRADGTGLGLAIVREIAEAQNGTVRCEPGRQGARFTVELPWRRS